MVCYDTFWSGQFRTTSCEYKTMTSLPKYGVLLTPKYGQKCKFESFCLHCARYNSVAEATSLLSSVASLATTRKLIIFLFSTCPFFFFIEKPSITFSVIMTLRSRQYISDFADLTKPTTRAIIADLTDIFTPFFNKTFQDFLQVIFTRFSPGSLVTNFDIYFEPTANVTKTSIIQALERGNGTKDLQFEILDKITFASGNPDKVETLETTEEGLKSVSSCLKCH